MSLSCNSQSKIQGVFLPALFLLATGLSAQAMIVSRFDLLNPHAEFNITAPEDDPGWYNVSDNSTASSSSYLYLGNQWVLTAGHVEAGTLHLANGTFNLIPGTDYRLTNPTGDYWQLDSQGQKILGPLTTNSDLRMFRVNTDTATGLTPEELNPGIKPITVATTTPAVDTPILMMGIGNSRNVNLNDANQQGLFHYQVNTSGSSWVWSGPMNSGGNFHGFTVNSTRHKRWGTNRVSPDSQIEHGWAISDGDNYVVTTVGGGVDVLTLIARFDPLGPDSDEAMGGSGDSGGPVFISQTDGQWELAGIMNSRYFFPDQSAVPYQNRQAIYGNWTAFADLSEPHYYQQIADLRAQSNYSIMGDINLDGVVSGNGSGPWESDDVTALFQGWGYQKDEANILTWKMGDLNQDGITNLADYVLLRNALGGAFAGGFGGASGAGGVSTVPEPRSWLLLLSIFGGLWWLFRPRRRWATAPVRRRA